MPRFGKDAQGESLPVVYNFAATILALFLIGLTFYRLKQLVMNPAQVQQKLAISKAQSLAYQIAILESRKLLPASRSVASVSPSSEGSETEAEGAKADDASRIFTDPWGQPYHYRVHAEGNARIVDIWSVGENAVKTQVEIPSGF